MELIDHTSEINNDEGISDEKLMVQMVGHHYEDGEKMVVTSEDILANAAKNIVMNRTLHSKSFLKSSVKEDDNDDNVNMTDSENYDNK